MKREYIGIFILIGVFFTIGMLSSILMVSVFYQSKISKLNKQYGTTELQLKELKDYYSLYKNEVVLADSSGYIRYFSEQPIELSLIKNKTGQQKDYTANQQLFETYSKKFDRNPENFNNVYQYISEKVKSNFIYNNDYFVYTKTGQTIKSKGNLTFEYNVDDKTKEVNSYSFKINLDNINSPYIAFSNNLLNPFPRDINSQVNQSHLESIKIALINLEGYESANSINIKESYSVDIDGDNNTETICLVQSTIGKNKKWNLVVVDKNGKVILNIKSDTEIIICGILDINRDSKFDIVYYFDNNSQTQIAEYSDYKK